MADGPAADPSGSIDIDDLALSTRIGGAHKKPGHSRGKLNGRRAQQIAARGSAAGGACPGDLAGSGSDLPSDGAKEVGGVPGSSGRANVVNTPPEVGSYDASEKRLII